MRAIARSIHPGRGRAPAPKHAANAEPLRSSSVGELATLRWSL